MILLKSEPAKSEIIEIEREHLEVLSSAIKEALATLNPSYNLLAIRKALKEIDSKLEA